MKRAALILNPTAGGGSSSDLHDRVVQALVAHGLDVSVSHTSADPDSARRLALEASQSCDVVIAGGGDGTVHGVIQGVAGTGITMGVLPLGTANALARNLQIPIDPLRAVEALLTYKAKSIPLGRAETMQSNRWFVVMAGAGPDGRLIREMRPDIKARCGRTAYYIEALRLYLTKRFPPFRVDYRLAGDAVWHTRRAAGVMAARVPDLGGMFAGLTANASLHHPHLLLHLLASPAHMTLPAWMILGRTGLAWQNPWLSTLEVEEVHCRPLDPAQHIYAQVDGEFAGELPLKLGIVPDTLQILMPSDQEHQN